MPSETFTFPFKLNISLQVGDVLYYAETTTEGGFNTAAQSDIVRVGDVTAIDQDSNVVTCNVSNTFTVNENDLPYMFFGKDNRVNTGSIVGYYSKVKFVNDSTEKGIKKGEMFAASCDVFESSK